MKRPEPPSDDENPGVPGFASWRVAYITVFLFFVFTVIFLAWFSHYYA